MRGRAQHEEKTKILTLSLSKGEERRAKHVSRSGGPEKATNAASLSERPDELT